MTDMEFLEVDSFVQWIVDIINKIKELFASLTSFLNGEDAEDAT